MECTHLAESVKLACAENDIGSLITKGYECSECQEKSQNWLCLHCGSVNCGRYVKGHAKQHAEASEHHVCISCDVFSVYCYKCDEYISNDTDDQSIEQIRKQLMKRNEVLNEVENERKEVPEVTLPDDESIVDNTADNGKQDGDLSDNSESKRTKSTDENPRSLRSRSRKRSHSDDSTENHRKEKKISPCNGKVKEKKVVGLKNLGNTCFMNAVLQSLSNIQEFSCYFNTLPALEMKSNGRKVYHSRSYTRQEMTDVVMAEELRKVLINLNTGGCGSKGAISPECLFLVIWKVVPRFRGYQQQDAHEFLRYMLDRLHTELLQLLPSESKEPVLPRPGAASIVTAVFGGTLQSEVRCLACGTESKKFDPFLDLSLELPEISDHDDPVSLNDCLASFVQVEELADTERYYCSSCKCKQKSTKQIRIRRLPNVLCLHLKRFRWHNYFRTKVDTSISFPINALNMSQFVLGNLPETRRSGLGNNLYDLAAVIVHHGSGAGSGHYTAFAINDSQWFHFNDQTVRATDEQTVANCKPYILFYIRRELSLPQQAL